MSVLASPTRTASHQLARASACHRGRPLSRRDAGHLGEGSLFQLLRFRCQHIGLLWYVVSCSTALDELDGPPIAAVVSSVALEIVLGEFA